MQADKEKKEGNEKKMEQTSSSRVVWLDVVRLVAMFAVVMCHCCDPFNFCPGPEPPDIESIRLFGAAYGSLLRPCVPLFVMLTGALLLPVRRPSGEFYRRRIFRVLWPFLLWSVIYALFPWFTGLLGLRPEVLLDFFPYSEPGSEATRQSLEVSLKYVAAVPLNFSAVHLWYIYLLIGLYLYLPVFSAWVERASERAKLGFLALWGLTLCVPFYRELVSPYLWGSCSWNEFHALYYFAGFNGYLLLGHYLRRHRPSLRLALGLGLPAFAIGFVVTFCGFRHYSALPGCTQEQLELFFYYLSPNVVLMSAPLFLWCSYVRVGSLAVQRLLANLTRCGFGVYLVHYFLTGPSIGAVRAAGVPLALQIPLGALLAFFAAWAFVALVYRLLGERARYVVG